jgi:hypothetical protein
MSYHLEWYLYQELKARRKKIESEKFNKIKNKHLIITVILMGIYIILAIVLRKFYWLFYLFSLFVFLPLTYLLGEYRRANYLHYRALINITILETILSEVGITTKEQINNLIDLVKQRAKSLKFSTSFFKGLISFLAITVSLLKPIFEFLPKSSINNANLMNLISSISIICFYSLVIIFFFVKPLLSDLLDIDFYRINDLQKILEDINLRKKDS